MGERITEDEVRRRMRRTHVGKQGEGEVTANPDWFPRTLAIVGVRWVEDHYEEAP